MSSDTESVEYQIRVDAIKALQQLEEINKTASSVPEVIQNVEKTVQNLADKFGVSFASMRAELQAFLKDIKTFQQALEVSGTNPKSLGNPLLEQAANVQSPFAGVMDESAGWK